jgi:hypothetical protein
LAECPHYAYVRHRLEGAGIVVDELDVFAVWKRRAIVEYCVREIQNSGVGTPVIVATKIVLAGFDELAETIDTFGIDVATVFEYPLLRVSETKHITYVGEPENYAPLIIVRVLKFVDYDERVLVAI